VVWRAKEDVIFPSTKDKEEHDIENHNLFIMKEEHDI
jgi:hypothetical protein